MTFSGLKRAKHVTRIVGIVAALLLSTTGAFANPTAPDDTFRSDANSVITAKYSVDPQGICGPKVPQTEFWKNTLNQDGSWSCEHIGCVNQSITGLAYSPIDGYLYGATEYVPPSFATTEIPNYRFLKFSKGPDGKVVATVTGETFSGYPIFNGFIDAAGNYGYTFYANSSLLRRAPGSTKKYDSYVVAPEYVGRNGMSVGGMFENSGVLWGIKGGQLTRAVTTEAQKIEFKQTSFRNTELNNDSYITALTSTGEDKGIFTRGFQLSDGVMAFTKFSSKPTGQMWQVAVDNFGTEDELVTVYLGGEHLNSSNAAAIGAFSTTVSDTLVEVNPLADPQGYLGKEQIAFDFAATNNGPVIANSWSGLHFLDLSTRTYADGSPIILEHQGLSQVFETDTDRDVTTVLSGQLTTRTPRTTCSWTGNTLSCQGKHLVPNAKAKVRAGATVADPCPTRLTQWEPIFDQVSADATQGTTTTLTLPQVAEGTYPAPAATIFQLGTQAPSWTTIDGGKLMLNPSTDVTPGTYQIPVSTTFAPLGCSSDFIVDVTVAKKPEEPPAPSPSPTGSTTDNPVTPQPPTLTQPTIQPSPKALPKTGVSDVLVPNTTFTIASGVFTLVVVLSSGAIACTKYRKK